MRGGGAVEGAEEVRVGMPADFRRRQEQPQAPQVPGADQRRR